MKRRYELIDVTGCEPGASSEFVCEPMGEADTKRPRHMLLDESAAESFRADLREFDAMRTRLEEQYEALYASAEWVDNDAFEGHSPLNLMLMDLYAPTMRRYLEAKPIWGSASE
jgi:hypothetical protein